VVILVEDLADGDDVKVFQDKPLEMPLVVVAEGRRVDVHRFAGAGEGEHLLHELPVRFILAKGSLTNNWHDQS